MNKRFIKLCFIVVGLVFVLASANAKKAKFGQYIIYDGEMENSIPKGAGKLIVKNMNSLYKKYPITFEGQFDGWSADGYVFFLSTNAEGSFSGKVQIYIAADGNSVSFKLLSGELRNDYGKQEISPEQNHVVTCTPEADNLYTTSTPFELKKEIKDNESKFYFSPSRLPYPYSSSRNYNWYAHTVYSFGKKVTDYYEMIEHHRRSSNKTIVDTLAIINQNKYTLLGKTHFTFDYSNKLIGFEKRVSSGILKMDNDITTFTTKDGKKGIVYELRDGTIKPFDTTKGDYLLSQINELSSVYSPTFTVDLCLKIFFGEAAEAATKAKDEDPQGMFDLGLALIDGSNVMPHNEKASGGFNQIPSDITEGENWIQKSVKKGNANAIAYIKDKEEKAIAAIREKEEEQRKVIDSYGAHQDEDGQFFVNNMQAMKEGSEQAYICIGLCYQFGYGINKNLQKAFEYYKKAAEASDQKVKACGNFMMGMCYWKGEGTTKSQVQAYKSWMKYSDYTKEHWDDITDWIGKWTNNKLNQLAKPREMLAYKHYYHAQCYEQGIGTQKFLEEAIAFYNAAVQWADIADAWYKIGYYTEIGKWRAYYGIPDRDYAKACYRKAASLGSSKAKQALNRM